MNKINPTQHTSPKSANCPTRWLMLGIVLAGLIAVALGSPQSTPSASPASSQKTFKAAKEAADALIQAAEQGDIPALVGLFGEENKDLVVTEDEVQARNAIAAFAARAKEKNVLEPDPKNKNRVFLSVGNEDWPMPIPIVKEKGQWRFDVSAGRQEILYRRIGENELDAIQICRGYVDAQHEYALQKREGF